MNNYDGIGEIIVNVHYKWYKMQTVLYFLSSNQVRSPGAA